MPKQKQTSSDPRLAQLKAMSGSEFAMEVARDFLFLARTERANAVRMLSALNETINKESTAQPA